MKRLLAVLAAVILFAALGSSWADAAPSARLRQVRHHHRVTRHHAHRAGRHHRVRHHQSV